MPILDLFPSRVTLHESGFELRHSRVAWEDVVRARVEKQLLVELHCGCTAAVPRNAHGYLELFDALVERRLVEVPEQLQWSTMRWALPLVLAGVCQIVLCVPALRRLSSYVIFDALDVLLFLAGVACVVIAVCSLEHWSVVEGRAVRRSIFGTRVYDDTNLRGTGQLVRSALGHPLASLETTHWLVLVGSATSELLPLVLNRPLPVGRAPVSCASDTPPDRYWKTWVVIVLFFGVQIPQAADHGSGAVLGWLGLMLFIGCGLTAGRLLVRFRPEGLYRWTLLGRRFDEAASFKLIHGARLVRNDGSNLDFGVSVPVDWILRHWMPNPVSSRHDGYRSTTPGSNARSVGSYAFVAGAARPCASPAPSHDNAPRVMRSRTRR